MSEPDEKPNEVDDLAPWLEVQADGTSVLRLEEPVVLGPVRVERLYIRKIQAKHLRSMKSIGIAGRLELLEALSNESRAVIDELGARDASRALGAVELGFSSGPATGGA
jgi:hypothetical protein